MCEDKHRYFIELQMDEKSDVPRSREAEVRRAHATQFIGHVAQWLEEEALKDKVVALAVTALGQVLITCEQDIISRIREDEKQSIAVIRPGTSLSDSIQRISGW